MSSASSISDPAYNMIIIVIMIIIMTAIIITIITIIRSLSSSW